MERWSQIWNMFWGWNQHLGPAKCWDRREKTSEGWLLGFWAEWLDKQWNHLLLWGECGRCRWGLWKGGRVERVCFAQVWHVLSHPSRGGVQRSGQNQVEDFSLSGELSICKLWSEGRTMLDRGRREGDEEGGFWRRQRRIGLEICHGKQKGHHWCENGNKDRCRNRIL